MEHPEVTIHDSCAPVAPKNEDLVSTFGGGKMSSGSREDHTGCFSVGVVVGEAEGFNASPGFAGTVEYPQIAVTISLVHASEDDEVVVIKCKGSMTCARWWWCIGCSNCSPLGLVLARFKLVQIAESLCLVICRARSCQHGWLTVSKEPRQIKTVTMKAAAHSRKEGRTAAAHASKEQESASNLCEGVSRASCWNISDGLDLFPEHTLQSRGIVTCKSVN